MEKASKSLLRGMDAPKGRTLAVFCNLPLEAKTSRNTWKVCSSPCFQSRWGGMRLLSWNLDAKQGARMMSRWLSLASFLTEEGKETLKGKVSLQWVVMCEQCPSVFWVNLESKRKRVFLHKHWNPRVNTGPGFDSLVMKKAFAVKEEMPRGSAVWCYDRHN